ncbi:hypothetical protein ACEPAG_5330 [Sanghuangporus baumii]
MSDRDQQSVASTSRPGYPIPPLPDFPNARPYRFVWDASARRTGPGSTSGTSEGRGDYFAYRPALGNFNFSSTSLALGAIPSDWSSAKHGFNAISTLVNSPHNKSAPPKAHASVPPVVPSQLPRVRRKDFDGYLKAITPDWEQFEKTVQPNQEGQTETFAAGLAEMESELPATPRSPQLGKGSSIPPLDSIPSTFFSRSFDLSDPGTFATVTEQDVRDGETPDPSALSHSLPLLEKLSHYADTIELHLIREISLRSSSFFAALTNLNELQSESAQCLERIRKLRGMLRDIDESEAKKGLELVRLERKIQNLGDVREGVKTMRNVTEMLSLAGSLASGGEWDTALNIVEELERLWNREEIQQLPTDSVEVQSSLKSPSVVSRRNSMLATVPESINEEPEPVVVHSPNPSPPVISVSSLSAFASLPEHLRALTSEIASSLTSELVSVLRTDLVNQMDSLIEANQESASDEARDERLATLRDRLRPQAQGLLRTKALKGAVSRWSTVSLVEIRTSMKRHLSLSEELDEEDSVAATRSNDKGSNLRNFLRGMTHEDYMFLMRALYGTLLRGIQELQTQNAILTEVVKSLQMSESSLEESLQEDLADLLSSVTELAHSRTSRILAMRSEQHATLDLSEFLGVFNETWNFVIRTETICRRMIVGLRGVAVSQAKTFLQTMHQNRISQSAKFVEEEHWSAVDVTSNTQALVNVIIDSAVRDSPELVVPQTSSLPPSPSQTNGIHPQTTSSKHLLIEDRKYFAVSATLNMFGLLIDYLKIIVNLSLLTTDAVGRVIEFLKAFNSRTCQVVLGAGAMRSAGLKNITAKHLALASQSLSIVIALIPYVRECFRRHLNPKQAVMLVEFDKLKRDYQEHQQEIHSKLIAIMGDRLSAHCKTLQTVDWSASRDVVNEYMTLLVKETITLHKVLSRYLQESALEFIMSQVFAAINHRLSEEYGKIDLPNQEAKERLLRDARYLHQNFSGLKNVNASAGMLETVVSEKQIPRLDAQPDQSLPKSSVPPVLSNADNTQSHVAQQHPHPHAASTMESANERLRNIFRRTTLKRHDTKPIPATHPPHSPIAENQTSTFFPEKPPVDEPATRPLSPPPPATPEKEKLGPDGSTHAIIRPSSPLSPRNSERSGSRSPRPFEKALPIPVPTLDADGNIIDPPEHFDAPDPQPTENGTVIPEKVADDSVVEDEVEQPEENS